MGVGKAGVDQTGVGQMVPNQERTSSLVLAVAFIESPQTLIVMAFPTKQKLCLLFVSGEPPITVWWQTDSASLANSIINIWLHNFQDLTSTHDCIS